VVTFGGALVGAAVLRYLVSATSKGLAALKVAAVTAVLVVSGWLAVSTSPRGRESTVEAATTAPVDRASAIARALEAIESAPDAPPRDAVSDLVAAQADFHRLMGTGQIVISEGAARGLARAGKDGGVGELLEEIAYHADDEYARLRAAEGLVERGNALGVPALIELLRMDTPVLLRMDAVDALRQATDQRFGYEAEGDPEEQRRALAHWEAWWESHRSEPLPGTRTQEE